MDQLIAQINAIGPDYLGAWWPSVWITVWTLVKIVAILLPLILAVAYLTYWERKLIGWMHVRMGPNRTGPLGLLQPIADAMKLIFKEITVPSKANRVLFFVGPILAFMTSFAAWAVIPFGPEVVLADINAGLLFIMAITSLEVYGVIIAGWASNSKYAFLGAMRASAQMISYEIAMGFCFVVVLMVSGTMNLSGIVEGQTTGYFADMGLNFLSWNWLPLLPVLVIYFVSGVAETNRHPFDVVEGESEIVAGHMVEYSSMSFALFFLSEYANMWLISVMTVLMFLGGWDAPVAALAFIPGWIWLAIKTFLVVSMFIWIRASFPRYRYDQIMRLGWKVFLPLSLALVVIVAIWMQTPWNIWAK